MNDTRDMLKSFNPWDIVSAIVEIVDGRIIITGYKMLVPQR